jgi:hypothetical protein
VTSRSSATRDDQGLSTDWRCLLVGNPSHSHHTVYQSATEIVEREPAMLELGGGGEVSAQAEACLISSPVA